MVTDLRIVAYLLSYVIVIVRILKGILLWDWYRPTENIGERSIVSKLTKQPFPGFLGSRAEGHTPPKSKTF